MLSKNLWRAMLLPTMLLSILTMLLNAIQPLAAQNHSSHVKRVYVSPVRCKYTDCWECATPQKSGDWKRINRVGHGDIRVVYSNGKTVKITASGDALGEKNHNQNTNPGVSNGPQISPDRRTIGWTRGQHKTNTSWSIGGTMFVNSQLVLFRNGKTLRVLQVPGTFIEGWRFWNRGRYVAIGSRGHHGMGYCRLFDVATGKLLERISTPEANSKNLKWAAGLTV